MAVARRAVLLRALLLAALPAAVARPQPGPAAPEAALRALYGLAELQLRAAALAASRDTRPEVKPFAAEMERWRGTQVPRLQGLLAERGIPAPGMTRDQRTVWEGLEPLDFLALSRRYAEIQQQALEREIQGYEGAAESGDAAVSALAAEWLPELRRRLEEARRMHEAVKP
jgi:predicted outer membrane protein